MIRPNVLISVSLVCLLTRAGVCELLIQRECLDKVETFVRKNVLMDDLKSCCLLHCPRSLCEAAAYSIFPFTLTLLLHWAAWSESCFTLCPEQSENCQFERRTVSMEPIHCSSCCWFSNFNAFSSEIACGLREETLNWCLKLTSVLVSHRHRHYSEHAVGLEQLVWAYLNKNCWNVTLTFTPGIRKKWKHFFLKRNLLFQ